ncbi:MAG: class I SAM-dependent methyltransferase [Prevotellaceae bacterium]|jgi:hypothetical protein|nr:class I SAM-dependent methyltransferase [Prevotellaceae bacterium]
MATPSASPWCSPATQSFICEHANADVHALLLRKSVPSDVDLHFAVQQIEGRQKAREKLPALAANPFFIFPAKLAMEQCSSESAALYKARLFVGRQVADLTGGLGVDALYAAKCATGVCYVEQSEALCELARRNFSTLGMKNIEVHCDDGIRFLQNTSRRFDAVYVDPSRRGGERGRQVLLASCEPNVLLHWNFLLSKTSLLALKASPMLDVAQALRELRGVCEVHVVAVKNDCKELLFICGQGEVAEPLIRCVNILPERVQQFDFNLSEERLAVARYAEKLRRYLYEPNVALLKAGTFKLPCILFGVEKLHPDTHLYTSDSLLPDFPGRAFEVQQVFSSGEPLFKQQIVGSNANVAVRNYPLTVAEIRRRYKIGEGGSVYLFAATLCGGERRIVKAAKVES